jgi:ferredoxin
MSDTDERTPMSDTFIVTLQPQGWSFAADGQISLLAAAERAGIRLPSSCRNGTCRTCLCRMASGQVTYRIAWPGLTPDEKREGHILPCVAYAAADITLEAGAASRI